MLTKTSVESAASRHVVGVALGAKSDIVGRCDLCVRQGGAVVARVCRTATGSLSSPIFSNSIYASGFTPAKAARPAT